MDNVQTPVVNPGAASDAAKGKPAAKVNAIYKLLGTPKVVAVSKLTEYQKKKFRSEEKIPGSFQMAVAKLVWTLGAITITASIYREREAITKENGAKAERRFFRAAMPQGWQHDNRDEKATAQVEEFLAANLAMFKTWARETNPELLDLSKQPSTATTASSKASKGKGQADSEVYDVE